MTPNIASDGLDSPLSKPGPKLDSDFKLDILQAPSLTLTTLSDFIHALEKSIIARGFEKLDTGVDAERAYQFESLQDASAEIAPWSSAGKTRLILHVHSLASHQQALTSFEETTKKLFPSLNRIIFSWKQLVDDPFSETLVWAGAPHPGWNGFIERRLSVHSDGVDGGGGKWQYRAVVLIQNAYAIELGLSDLRLLAFPETRISSRSYTFGLSAITSDTQTQTRLIRAADQLVNGTIGVCERLSFVHDFGFSCALTVSRVLRGNDEHAYSIEDAVRDMQNLVDAINSKLLEPGQTPIRFTKPVVTLASANDFTKDLIFKLAGGAEVLSIRIKGFMDPDTVCAKLRALESQTTFWAPYEHELIDNITGEKRYEFYGVYRPKIAYPFNRTYLEPSSSTEWTKYFTSSRALSEYLRSMLHPYVYPVDQFLGMLDSFIDTNVHKHPQFDCKMQAGMLRLMPNDAFTNIHIDHPPDASLGRFKNVLSTNFYTARSDSAGGKGGELLVWDAPLIRFGADLADVPKDYMSVNLEPEEGDVIMICPELPHAIARVTHGARLSLNVFLGLLEDRDELRVWN